jgi:uncharacterized protein (TIGR00255 family)
MQSKQNLVSMTGYGRGEWEQEGVRVVTEIRSVNHRFLEIVVRLPHGFLALEDAVRKEVQGTVRRGRVDVFITVEKAALPERGVQVDWPLVERFIEAGRELEKRVGVHFDLTVSDIIAKPEFWIIEEPGWDAEAHRDAVLRSVRIACGQLAAMRKREGEHLAEDLFRRLQNLKKIVENMAREAPEVAGHVRNRLRARMEELLQNADIGEDRLLSEVAVWVEKADITEELTRLHSHMRQFAEALESAEPVGRRLDFLIQEMNREVNTIGSKAGLASISEWVVEGKSILEKMKEQVQNIE